MKKNKGFTLVEIMIVIVIIGLLAAMAVPAFNAVRQKALEKSAVSDMRLIVTEARSYFMENPAATSVGSDACKGAGKLIENLSGGVTIANQTINSDGANQTINASVAGNANVTYTFDM